MGWIVFAFGIRDALSITMTMTPNAYKNAKGDLAFLRKAIREAIGQIRALDAISKGSTGKAQLAREDAEGMRISLQWDLKSYRTLYHKFKDVQVVKYSNLSPNAAAREA